VVQSKENKNLKKHEQTCARGDAWGASDLDAEEGRAPPSEREKKQHFVKREGKSFIIAYTPREDRQERELGLRGGVEI